MAIRESPRYSVVGGRPPRTISSGERGRVDMRRIRFGDGTGAVTGVSDGGDLEGTPFLPPAPPTDSFDYLGGAAADEADGALPPASQVQVVKDLPNPNNPPGTDEGRAMMQIVHDVAPGASLDFYTAFVSEQDFA